MTLAGRRILLFAAALCLALQSVTAQARDVKAPWLPLPEDAKLVTDPAVLTALFADRTVRAVYLPQGSKWREYTAADGRTVWEFDGCLLRPSPLDRLSYGQYGPDLGRFHGPNLSIGSIASIQYRPIYCGLVHEGVRERAGKAGRQ